MIMKHIEPIKLTPIKFKVDSLIWYDGLDDKNNVLQVYKDEYPIRAICHASITLRPLWTNILIDHMSPNLKNMIRTSIEKKKGVILFLQMTCR
jgi:hypothetical protein